MRSLTLSDAGPLRCCAFSHGNAPRALAHAPGSTPPGADPGCADDDRATVKDPEEYRRFRQILAAAGVARVSTVPVRPGTKIPAVRWADYQDGEEGPHFPDTLARLLLTGRRSSDLAVIDVDTKGGGFDALERLEALHGAIPRTLSVRSPTGGLHIYVLPSRPLRTCAGVPARGIDIRGEGGVVMVPGSEHPRGGVYRIEEQ